MDVIESIEIYMSIKVKLKPNVTTDEGFFYACGNKEYEKLDPHVMDKYTDANCVYTISLAKNTYLPALTRQDSFYINRSIQAIAEVYCTLDNKELSEIYPELFI